MMQEARTDVGGPKSEAEIRMRIRNQKQKSNQNQKSESEHTVAANPTSCSGNNVQCARVSLCAWSGAALVAAHPPGGIAHGHPCALSCRTPPPTQEGPIMQDAPTDAAAPNDARGPNDVGRPHPRRRPQ